MTPRPMRHYRPDDLPVLCRHVDGSGRVCGERLRWVASRFAWQHVKPGHSHGPLP